MIAPRRPSERADTFTAAVRATLGPTLADEFYAPYVEKIWGRSGDELSAELARRRIRARSSRDLVRRFARPGVRRAFLYPRLGFGQISEAIAAAATSRGATIALGVAAESIAPGADGVTVIGSDGSRIDAPLVFSTLPVAAMARLVAPAPPGPVAAAAAALASRGLVLVYLVLEQARYSPFDAHYFPEPDVAASRVSEPKNYRESRADPTGTTVLCAELPASVGDERWQLSDADLGALVVDDLARAGLPPVTPAAVEVRRVPTVYPVYDLAYAANLARVQQWLDGVPRIVTLGRHARFAYDNSHHGIALGWVAADAVGAGGTLRDATRGRPRSRPPTRTSSKTDSRRPAQCQVAGFALAGSPAAARCLPTSVRLRRPNA